jgi:hypothetical protein
VPRTNSARKCRISQPFSAEKAGTGPRWRSTGRSAGPQRATTGHARARRCQGGHQRGLDDSGGVPDGEATRLDVLRGGVEQRVGGRQQPGDGEIGAEDALALPADELARGLATWAAFYQALPAAPRLQGDLDLERSIARLPRPDSPWTPMEAVTFSRLGEVAGWDVAVQTLEAPRAAGDALSLLSAAFCRLLASGDGPLTHWAVHVVTPAAAIRTLLPLVPDLPIETVYARLWHVNAALATGLVPPAAPTSTPPPDPPPAPAEIAARAARHGDFHVIKLTEAALRENAIRPDPAHLLAAQRLLDDTAAW